MHKILVIRFHAIGDIASVLPACNGLRKKMPDTQIDFLTSDEAIGLVNAAGIFNNVYSVTHQRNSNFLAKIKLKSRILKSARYLKKNNYNVIIDLQNNSNSKIILNVTNPPLYSLFDKYSLNAHSTRALGTIRAAGFPDVKQEFIRLNNDIKSKAETLLVNCGCDIRKKLVVLNPAGLWITRNWPIENYVSLAKLFPPNETTFLVLGDERINAKAEILKKSLGENLIDLSGKTTLSEAFGILGFCSLVISEDSGLAHMAWSLGVPLVLMLGSTKNVWTCHTEGRIVCLNSSDLECGNCMQAECKFGDTRCLVRYTPEFIKEKSNELIQNYTIP